LTTLELYALVLKVTGLLFELPGLETRVLDVWTTGLDTVAVAGVSKASSKIGTRTAIDHFASLFPGLLRAFDTDIWSASLIVQSSDRHPVGRSLGQCASRRPVSFRAFLRL
jgi:hypothetical protein